VLVFTADTLYNIFDVLVLIHTLVVKKWMLQRLTGNLTLELPFYYAIYRLVIVNKTLLRLQTHERVAQTRLLEAAKAKMTAE
jgi:hypothetical protein